jgi:hypothetical protein
MRNLFLTLAIKEGYTSLSREQINQFNQEAIFISRLYNRFISTVKLDSVQRITIELVNPTEKILFYPLSRLIKVCRITKPFDILEFLNTSAEKDRVLLDLIMNTLTEASVHYKWSESIFREAYLKVLDINFKNEYTLLPAKVSPNKKYTASVGVQIDRTYATIFIDITGDQMQKVELIKVKPWEEEFSITKRIRWVDNDELVVSNSDEEINFKYSLVGKNVEMILTPKLHNEKYLQDELILLNPVTSETEYVQITNSRIEEIRNRHR